ncbi:hypothetical protein KIW84_064304 [Lathyrus oleraceus]|uniref:Uncharacterized protein n=1 Tax=Pisum sativum TaxID=3888 RepID=A0A9D4W9V6_PEA|nr:hypothetical protein KIW84_064304 [Pisum sativum]
MEEERRNTTYEDEKFPGLVGIDEDEDEQRTSSTQLVKCEQIAEAATTQLQEANEAMRAATKAAKAATETAQRMEREMNAWKEFMMKKFDSSTFVSHSHHYDDDLDDQSLDED